MNAMNPRVNNGLTMRTRMNQRRCRRSIELKREHLLLIGGMICFALIFISVIFFVQPVTAQREGERIKMVTSVEIKQGDTLWDIAKVYITDEYSNIQEYVKELKKSNRLESDTIHAGNYIIVPYYTDAEDIVREFD